MENVKEIVMRDLPRRRSFVVEESGELREY